MMKWQSKSLALLRHDIKGSIIANVALILSFNAAIYFDYADGGEFTCA